MAAFRLLLIALLLWPYAAVAANCYDNAGNPTTYKGTAQSFDDDNRRSASGFAYDGNGNPTSYAGTTCAFDVENRLTAYGAHGYGYRSDGLRAWKQPSGSAKTYFLYDGGNPILEMDATGAVTAINDFARPNRSNVGSTIAKLGLQSTELLELRGGEFDPARFYQCFIEYDLTEAYDHQNVPYPLAEDE